MAKKNTGSSPFTKFFKEESQEFLKKSEKVSNVLTLAKSKVLTIPEAKDVEEIKIKEKWKSLRKFFISSKGTGLSKDTGPVHLNSNLLSEQKSLNYPVWMSENGAKSACVPMYDLLSERVHSLYQDDSGSKIVNRMIPGIVLEAANILQTNGSWNLEEVFEKASLSLEDKLDLKGSDKESFETEISALKSAIPTKGVLIPYTANASFRLLQEALLTISKKGQQAFETKIKSILPGLEDLIKIESENDPEAIKPEHLKSSMDFADSYLDFDKMSTVMPESASEHIPADRYQRIKEVIKILKKEHSPFSGTAIIILQNNLEVRSHSKIQEVFADSEIIDASENTSFTSSIQTYKDQLNKLTRIFKAIRIGELEIENKYISDVHDDFFSAFDSSSFSEVEFAFIPPIIVIADAHRIVAEELTDFTALLHGNFPVNILALKTVQNSESDHLIDPTSLAVSHRNTYVAQMTALYPQRLFEVFNAGLSSHSPSFFHVEVPLEETDEQDFTSISTSIEARDFPGFIYNGKVGTAWGSRFDIHDNPQFEKDWPCYEYSTKGLNGKEQKLELPLTYADYVAIQPAYKKEFMPVEPAYWTDDLVLLSDYVHLPEAERFRKVPYIWTVGHDMVLGKIAVSWNLVTETSQKMDFWNYLQDCGGVHSYHAERATKKLEEQIREETAKEIEALKKQHESELQKVKEESTEDAMEHLTAALLDIDTEQILTTPAETSKTSTEESSSETPTESTAEILEEQKDEEEEEVISEEPWIETPLCTNCNECTDINNRMFNYNADKLAFIADPTAGTFAQLVEAAEKCPVKIIHPGKPLNPDEPDLDDLLKRAAKFN